MSTQSTLKIGTELEGQSIRYKITEVLGQGSFGITYKAKAYTVMRGAFGEELSESTTPKAIKEFFMQKVNERTASGTVTGMSKGSISYDYASKFKKEAKNLAQMKHPNIVRVIDYVEANGTYYYVMEFIEGENLNDYIKHHKLTEDEAVSIISDVASALQYMHETHHMLHLDLKPGNIMHRSSDGHIFLIDFGLSKHYNEEGEPESSTTVGQGTKGYAPIEQASYDSSRNAFRPTIDVYALGATLYKLLTGETPPDASMVNEDGLPPCPSNVSPSTWQAVVQAMQPKRKDRPQNIAAFHALLPDSSNDQFEEEIPSEDTEITEVSVISEDKQKPVQKDSNDKVYTNDTWGLKDTPSWAIVAILAIIPALFLIFVVKGCYGANNSKEYAVTNKIDVTKNDSVKTVSDYYYDSAIGSCFYTGSLDGQKRPHGRGMATFKDGRFYQGSFEHGVLQGDSAFFRYDNGDTFIGTFKNNSFHKGTYTIKSDGSSFTGVFRNGQPYRGRWSDSPPLNKPLKPITNDAKQEKDEQMKSEKTNINNDSIKNVIDDGIKDDAPTFGLG